ncbi:uncharacterized protein PHALS_10420 [Plasmopara halstedii]|uniref:RxLR-like protein n=1 Tax=Plasmopara halstedii TaxID=4781 RepID=A0A0P1AGL8_PLAHL|nr:uncharacterized protein PHALS_10420 [Plasmopara halstedii]CEG40208.1 hypothetical protein PHALS_10420 [Plasmopara halstedii]|eukprot:XP_024576577.1 hypothetical protein PHALS_10420 [Plasmopara halstedii]
MFSAFMLSLFFCRAQAESLHVIAQKEQKQRNLTLSKPLLQRNAGKSAAAYCA